MRLLSIPNRLASERLGKEQIKWARAHANGTTPLFRVAPTVIIRSAITAFILSANSIAVEKKTTLSSKV
jgi:hypothetical protein